MLANVFSTLSVEERKKFELIFNNYKNYMYAIALDFTKNQHKSEDIVSEALLRIIKNLNKIEDINSSQTRGFISVIIRNICIDNYRRDSKEISVDEEWPFEPTESFEETVINNETLKNYLKDLKPEFLHVLVYTYLYDYDDETIASLLNITRENVRKRRSRGIKSIQEKINEEESIWKTIWKKLF